MYWKKRCKYEKQFKTWMMALFAMAPNPAARFWRLHWAVNTITESIVL